MAEEVDPFEAAMASMDGEGEDQPAPADTETPAESSDQPEIDPFDAALGALDDEATESLGGEDPFEAALQVAKTEHSVAEAQKTSAKDGEQLDLGFLLDIKLEVTFEVGRAKMFISDLLSLGQGSVIELHRLVGEELEIFVNGHLFAVGEVVVVNEKFGGRITKIIRPEERIQRLGANYIM
jgi:flagellar motor switch protein FliN